jgi:allene oxide cyclase
MKRSFILVIGLALLAVGVVATTAGGHSTALTATFTVVERVTTDAITNKGVKKGDSLGDVLTFANAIYNASNTKKVGSDSGFCVRTNVGETYDCLWTTSLPGGQIAVQGPFSDAGDSTFAITGGTGKYSRARGWMNLHARNDKGTELDFVFHVQG